MSQLGFFDQDERLSKLNEHDKLSGLNAIVNWEIFRETLNLALKQERKSLAGRKRYDLVMMFKCLILQHLYNFSDQELEFQIRDRFTFSRFIGIGIEDKVPDANTFWDFREMLIKENVLGLLFDGFNDLLNKQGIKAEKGQIIDASFIEAPRQRNTREQNETIKEGLIPEEFMENESKKRQKDTDARWTKKNDTVHYGYKNHVCIDNKHKIIRNFAVTSADVHDSNECENLLTDNSSSRVWADSAYRSAAIEAELDAMGYQSKIHEKGYSNKPLNKSQKLKNTNKSKVRARVEHVFADIKYRFKGGFIRVIGKARAAGKITLTNLVYNLKRFDYIHRVSAT
jgi:transposase, IS5 family